MQLSWYVIQKVITSTLIKLRWFQSNSAHTHNFKHKSVLNEGSFSSSVSRYLRCGLHTPSKGHYIQHIRTDSYPRQKAVPFPFTFKYISILVNEFHVSHTQCRWDYTTFPDLKRMTLPPGCVDNIREAERCSYYTTYMLKKNWKSGHPKQSLCRLFYTGVKRDLLH